MSLFNQYDVVIFDCDGVLLDSNNLKIEAMKSALAGAGHCSAEEVTRCGDYFKRNFGLSRFHHVDYFFSELIDVTNMENIDAVKNDTLELFSSQCKSLYLSAAETEHIRTLLTRCDAAKFVASGSEQTELRYVLEQRGFSQYFIEIFGSPTKKVDLVENIVTKRTGKAVMIGDARSDFIAANENGIDFIFFRSHSNVVKEMNDLSEKNGFRIIDSFNELISEI